MGSVFPKPRLIVKEYDSQPYIRKKVLYGSYVSIDKIVPMLRNRGTLLERGDDDKIRIIGWQKDITRMRKQDVGLSFIVYLTLSKDEIVEEIRIDDSFNGGKGLLCSKDYLEKILKEQIEGVKFEPRIAGKFRLNMFKCFHIHEIMNSIYTSYFLFKEGHAGDGHRFYEEDITDLYADNGNLYVSSSQQYKDREPLYYELCFTDIFNHITFDKDGYMWIQGNVDAEFYVNDQFMFKDVIYQAKNDHIFLKLQKFVYRCLGIVQKELVPGYTKKIMNTNLYSSAMIGLIMQAIGIRAFSDNFNYIQYIMTAMQRPRKQPGCIGSILTEEEAETGFKGFNINNLV